MRTADPRDLNHAQPASHLAHGITEFRSLVSSSFVPLRVTTENDEPFAGRTDSAEADDVVFTEVTARPHLVERTPENIADGGSGYYKVSLLLSGSSILVQDGREVVMRAGDLSVYDTSRPYSLLFGEDFRNLIMMFPKDRLELPIPFTEQLTAVSLGREHQGLAPVITAFLSQFPAQLKPLDGRIRAKLAHTSLDLMGTLFSSILDTDPARRDPHQILLQKITAHIDQHLASPELSPGSIAAAHFISTRHLHALFRQADTTVSAWIRERRLERCRADLLDPVLADRTVSAIASRWGFSDAAHFSRVFKSAYGVSPSVLRLG
ncbi:helix-turn-helix domain-containing protein [Leucobacter chromiireducens]|uniref:Helix-turn-helix domain-containing protein n=1 Tax=Leucobacter chromiireducens subsp. solipictus TaxID=398235 RepID=A0ABS1SL81_9MICO|nr:helix-turn-helix domain-containing protein [Leucobacter chromiireducens]MBL3680043.1 helix-turn-helix domain-containing protein [Leucobacter chromiireducens subsp. solipictus]